MTQGIPANPLAVPFRLLRRTWRAATGKDLLLAPEMRLSTVTLGCRGAAWTIYPAFLADRSIVYSLGVGEEISFDCELIRRWALTVHAFDPTPRSIAWLRAQALPERFLFHPYGIAAQDGMRWFNPPADPKHVSHSVVDRGRKEGAIEAPVRRLATIMRELGHNRIDLVKMDIEGAEYEVIADLVASRLDIPQLLVEFHHRWREIGIEKTRNAIAALKAAGYRIFSVSADGEEYGFVKSNAGSEP